VRQILDPSLEAHAHGRYRIRPARNPGVRAITGFRCASPRHPRADYDELVAKAEKDYAGYWAKLARDNLVWQKPFTKSLDDSQAPFYKWFEDGLINASYNCLDRHLETIPNQTAIIFRGGRRCDHPCHV
jgi:hypothetical protein